MRCYSLRITLLLLAGLAGCLPETFKPEIKLSMKPTHPQFKFIRQSGDLLEYELLSNGLKVLLQEDHSSPVVTVMVTYLVGSRHESNGRRGSAHLLEHMMFKGTARYQKQKGTAIAAVLQRVGAHMNASTWTDGTNYYETLPSDQLDLALDIESDRMRGSLYREEDLSSEMHVGHSELEKIENSPFAMMDQALWQAAFTRHPYHFPVIGWRKDIENTHAADLKQFYDTYYWPNNAYLAVIGSYPPESILDKIAGYFEKIKASPAPIPPMPLIEPDQISQRHTEIRREDRIESVVTAHKAPAVTHSDTPALDVLGLILTNGKTSRLYRDLINTALVVDVRSEASKSHDPGLFMTQALLSPGVTHDEVREHILKAYAEIRQHGITVDELYRAKKQLETHTLFSRDGSYAIAQELSGLIAAGDWTLFSHYLDKIRALKVEDIQHAAQTYLNDARMTTAYLISKNPASREETPAVEKNPYSTSRSVTEEELLKQTADLSQKALKAEQNRKAPAVNPDQPLSERVSVSDIHGIRVLTVKTQVPEVVTITGSLEGTGQAYSANPVLPELVGHMLDEGTKRRNKFEIARLLESRGAQIAFQVAHKKTGFKAHCLAEDVPLVMELISEQLRIPLFDPNEFEKQKQRLEVDITHNRSSTSAQAESALSRLIYPPAHPYYEPTFEVQLEALKKTTREDLVRFHETHYSPKNMILVAAGDIDARFFNEVVENVMKNWPVNKVPILPQPAQVVLSEPKKTVIPIPEKSKFDVFFGHALPLRYGEPLYHAAAIANFILGGDFSSRLSTKVRDEYGLTYSIYSELSGLDRQTEGHWQISMILNPKFLDRGIEAALQEIQVFKDHGTTAKELAENKTTLKGLYKVSLSTTDGIATRLLTNEELQLPLTQLDLYPAVIDAVTLDQVREAIEKYFHPEKLQIAVAGSAEEEETPPDEE